MNDGFTNVLIGLAIVVLVMIAIMAIVMYVTRFHDESRYLKTKIVRTNGEERRYWERQLKRHYLPLISFIKV